MLISGGRGGGSTVAAETSVAPAAAVSVLQADCPPTERNDRSLHNTTRSRSSWNLQIKNLQTSSKSSQRSLAVQKAAAVRAQVG